MSDFDKEAEREKLREKYEHDQAEREATQRMSDLLLKGATMTNTHCGTCGDPLFRQDEATFCPSCHGTPDAVEGTELAAQPADEPDDSDPEPGSNPAQPAPDERDWTTEDSTPEAGSPQSPERAGRGGEAPADASPEQPSVSGADGVESRAPAGRVDENEDGRRDARRAEPNSIRQDGHDDGRTPSASSAGDVGDARASLVAALEKFSRKAAETDDPRHATECLKAAREASETLEILR
jgi:uncharacterized Zn finger protein (UPF0148 family)